MQVKLPAAQVSYTQNTLYLPYTIISNMPHIFMSILSNTAMYMTKQ